MGRLQLQAIDFQVKLNRRRFPMSHHVPMKKETNHPAILMINYRVAMHISSIRTRMLICHAVCWVELIRFYREPEEK